MPIRTRPVERLPAILALVKEVWEKNPDLRLGQLIANCNRTNDFSKLYYMEDDELVEQLKKLYRIE